MTAAVWPAWEAQRRRTLREALGVGVATGAYGVSFGAIATTGGLSVAQACALSVLVFTGASQFAFVGVVAGGGSPLSGAVTAVLLGTRNGLYGLRLAPLLGLRRRERPVGAHLVLDESTAVALAQPDLRAARLGFWATGLAVYALWNAATLAGAVGGASLGDPAAWGLDAAAPAAFVALLAPRLRGRIPWAVAVGAGLVALVLVPVAPAGVPVLAAALVAGVAGVSAASGVSGVSGVAGSRR
jgi:predicted branched-subunit amino acid permease